MEILWPNTEKQNTYYPSISVPDQGRRRRKRQPVGGKGHSFPSQAKEKDLFITVVAVCIHPSVQLSGFPAASVQSRAWNSIQEFKQA